MSQNSSGGAALAPEVVVVASGGAQIAGVTRAATPAFNGAVQSWNSSAIAGRLQSITVTAWASTPSLPGQALNQVIVSPPTGDKIVLVSGESRTWSVARNDDVELLRDFDVFADGNAYATITWTVVQ